MKKLILLLCCVLLVTSCNIFNRVDELCTVTTVYDQSKVTVNPAETTVSKGKTAKLTYTNIQGYNVTEIRVDGNPVQIPSDNTLYIPVNSDCVIEFISEEVIEYYTLLASGDPGLTISPSGEKVTPKGQSVNLALVAIFGNFIDSIYIDGVGTKMPYATTKLDYKFVANDTFEHTFRGVSRKMGSATITASSNADGTVAPSGTFSVLESSQKTFTALEKEFCSLRKWIVDGVDVNPTPTYTFHVTDNLSHTVVADFVKEPEWYILKITWVRDSIYVDDHRNYVPGSEVLNFYSDGTYTRVWNNKTYNYDWSLIKTTIPPILKCLYGACKIEVLNETKMVISIFNGFNQKETYVYHGILK